MDKKTERRQRRMGRTGAIWNFALRKSRTTVLADSHPSTLAVLWAQGCALHMWGSPAACGSHRRVRTGRGGGPNATTPCLPAGFRHTDLVRSTGTFSPGFANELRQILASQQGEVVPCVCVQVSLPPPGSVTDTSASAYPTRRKSLRWPVHACVRAPPSGQCRA